MKPHITTKSAQKMVDEAFRSAVQKNLLTVFIDGAHSISKIILAEYLPPIENAKTVKERKAAIEQLKAFLGKSDNLFPKETEKEAKPNENSESV